MARRTTSKNAPDGAAKPNKVEPETTAPDSPQPAEARDAPLPPDAAEPKAPIDGAPDESALSDNRETGQNPDAMPAESEAPDTDPMARPAAQDQATEPVIEPSADIPTADNAPHMPQDTADIAHAQAEISAQSAPKSPLLPLILGGVLAGGLGYAAHFLTDGRTSVGPDLDNLRSEIAALRAAIPATGPIEAEVLDLRAQFEALDVPAPAAIDLDALAAQLRSEVAQTVAPTDLQPIEAAIAAAQSRMDALEADLADLRDLAERRVAEAEAAIDAALASAGVDSLRAALETGAPYPDAVARLRDAGVAVPDVFAGHAASGIATLEALQEGFGDAARAALRVALQDAPAETTADRLGNFLRAQVGARSTVPREGDDPDAVLSRAGAAMEGGNLEQALSEIDALPEPAKAAMGDWLARAQARSAAVAALPDLATAITPE